MNDENTPKEKEVKRRFQSWLRPVYVNKKVAQKSTKKLCSVSTVKFFVGMGLRAKMRKFWCSGTQKAWYP